MPAAKGNSVLSAVGFGNNDNSIGDLAAFNTNWHLPGVVSRYDAIENGLPCAQIPSFAHLRFQLSNQIENGPKHGHNPVS